ncbi:MAG: thioredoxin domain-containing protein, partial [Candidatus Jordarchaeaceae archaeon]
AEGVSTKEIQNVKKILKSRGIVVLDMEMKKIDRDIFDIKFIQKSGGYKIPSIGYLVSHKYLFLGPIMKFPSGEPLSGNLGAPEWLAEKVSFRKKGLPYRGKEGGIEIIEFLDMECPFCRKQDVVLEEVLKRYNVKLYVAPFPLPNHPYAMKKHAISLCAEEKIPGSFWKFKEVFLNKGQDLPSGYGVLESCIPEMEKRIEEYINEARQIGVTGTPSFIIDGYLVQGYRDIDFFRSYFETGMPETSKYFEGRTKCGK